MLRESAGTPGWVANPWRRRRRTDVEDRGAGQGRVLSVRCAARLGGLVVRGSAVGWAGGKWSLRCGRDVLKSNQAVEGRWQPGTGLSGVLWTITGRRRAGGDGILLGLRKVGWRPEAVSLCARTNVALRWGLGHQTSRVAQKKKQAKRETSRLPPPGSLRLAGFEGTPYLETLCPGRAQQNLSTIRMSGYKAQMWGVSKSMLAFPPKFCSARGGPRGAERGRPSRTRVE